ncbi:MAG TPA: pentapeptide repeat-containing protein, partial [Candidatus Lambdaproteobacteria bacterium]|nr:pentapeptide repeat-containing protein [Candidatus Lambdaproteobacteria bacterium]
SGFANLDGANLDGAFLRSAILCKTIMPDGSVNNSGC